jgi:adenylate kinase family enzyme
LKDTLPILQHYGRQEGVVEGIDGMGSVEDVTQRLLRAVGKA